MRALRTSLSALLVLAACLTAAEAGRRVLDGYRLTSLKLEKNPNSLDLTWSEPENRSADALLAAIPADPDASAAWFSARPQAISQPSPPWVAQRRAAGNAEANYVWNAAALNEPTVLAYLNDNTSKLDDIFTFTPPDNQPHPRYRFYPGIETNFGVSNRFGWRGRDIAPAKPADVIRIAMLGDSTTNHYPEIVEHWLNLWATDARLGVRFEVINAARPAADAFDAAAIFDQELGPFDPDYVIVYGFGNPISTADALIQLPPKILKSAPSTAYLPESRVTRWSKRVSATLDPLAPWSAAADFLRHRIAGERGDSLVPEPPKPATQVAFPPDIDENDPKPATIAARRGGHLMGLDIYLQGLAKIDAVARQRHARVFVSTFRVLASDGLLLARGGADAVIYDRLNGLWWPYTYAEIHRIVAFFNRTLRAWAAQTGNGLIPVDEQMPWRSDLYGDGMHEQPTGEALHAWIVVQQLMPAIRDDLRQHRLPKTSTPIALDKEYWRIERIKITDAVATANAMNAAIPPPPADEIPGAFVLSKIAAADPRADVVAGATPTVRTSSEPSGYAASVPLDPAVKLSGRGRIEIRLKVTEGRLSIGVLNRLATTFLATTGVSQSAESQDIQLDIENLADIGSLMISNDRGQEHARSAGAVQRVVLKRTR